MFAHTCDNVSPTITSAHVCNIALTTISFAYICDNTLASTTCAHLRQHVDGNFFCTCLRQCIDGNCICIYLQQCIGINYICTHPRQCVGNNYIYTYLRHYHRQRVCVRLYNKLPTIYPDRQACCGSTQYYLILHMHSKCSLQWVGILYNTSPNLCFTRYHKPTAICCINYIVVMPCVCICCIWEYTNI